VVAQAERMMKSARVDDLNWPMKEPPATKKGAKKAN
jgi:hypothetical protein